MITCEPKKNKTKPNGLIHDKTITKNEKFIRS